MRILLFFTAVVLFHQQAPAQLNCKKSSSEKENTATCYHKNGTKSTVETWDKEKREGRMTAYDKQGKELFSFYLRTFAGHASAYLEYFPNGQVRKVEYSSAPDGGIQFYREWRSYDENGVQINSGSIEYPDELRLPSITEPDFKRDTVKPIVKKPEPEVFVPFTTVFKIINTSNKKVILELAGQKSKWADLKDSVLLCPAGDELLIDSLVLSKHYLEPEEIYRVQLSGKTKKREQFELISAQPSVSDGRKEYTWIIVRKKKKGN